MNLNFDEVNEFIRYEQFNEYFIKKYMHVGIIEYVNYSKSLLPSENYFNILNKLIEISEYNDNNFCINQHYINKIGFDINNNDTFANKINRHFNRQINELKNIQYTFNKCKLTNNIDYVIESRSLINIEDSNSHIIKYRLSKLGFIKIIKYYLGINGYSILVTCMSSIIFHYHAYILKWNTLTKTKMNTLSISIKELSEALNSNNQNVIIEDDIYSNSKHSSLDTPSENSLDDKSSNSKNTAISINKFNLLRNTVIPVHQLRYPSNRPFSKTFTPMTVLSPKDSKCSIPILDYDNNVHGSFLQPSGASNDNHDSFNELIEHKVETDSLINHTIDRKSTLSNKIFVLNQYIEHMINSISDNNNL